MFKKLKDKITEEVKIPSAKFTQSVQQLAQAVVSPGSNSSSFEHAANENFSIGGEFDDTPQNSPVKDASGREGGVAYRGGVATSLGVAKDTGTTAGFTQVDLHQQDSVPLKSPASGSGSGSAGGLSILSDAFNSLRRSSVSSVASDSSSFFPSFEPSGHTYNFQSDLESCSEASESLGPNVNKEQLLHSYQKIQQRYQKYKGRYADLARHYRELERENTKAKNVLAECQDKALRRMSELKEQCVLEKQAKAHLEEALRSDLEEKDHLIHTLETKIKLLKTSVDQGQQGEQTSSTSGISTQGNSETSAEVSPMHSGQEDLLSSVGDSVLSAPVLSLDPVSSEAEQALKEKVKKMEMLLLKSREDITSKCELIKNLESDKLTANTAVQELQKQLSAVQKREEEASLSLAKNKLSIHRELETKEEEIKKLKSQISSASNNIKKLQAEIVQIKEDSKKDLAAGKQEATRLIQAEMQQLVKENRNLEHILAARDDELAAKEADAVQLKQRLKDVEKELLIARQEKEEGQRNLEKEISSLKSELSSLQGSLESSENKGKVFDLLKPILEQLRFLRSSSVDLKSSVNQILHEAEDYSRMLMENVPTCIGRTLVQHSEELRLACEERDSSRFESEQVKCTLHDLSEKLRLLEETLSKEKAEAAAKVSFLETQLASSKLKHDHAVCELEEFRRGAEHELSAVKETLASMNLSEEDLRLKFKEVERMLFEEQTKAINVQDQVSRLEKESVTLREKLALQEHLKEQLEEGKKNLEQENVTMLAISNKMALDHHDATEKLALLESHISDLKAQLVESVNSREQQSQAQVEVTSLKEKLVKLEKESADLVAEKTSLSLKFNDKCKQNAEQDVKISDLRRSTERLQQCFEEIQEESKGKTSEIKKLEELIKNQEEKLLKSSDLTTTFTDLETKFKLKTEDCLSLEKELESANTYLSEKEQLLSTKINECNTLAQQLEKLSSEKSGQTSRIAGLLENQSSQDEYLKKVVRECNELKLRIGNLEAELSKKADELNVRDEDTQLISKLNALESENAVLSLDSDEKALQLQSMSDERASLKEELERNVKLLEEKTIENHDLAAKAAENESLTAQLSLLKEQYTQQSQLFDVKFNEKETQLDSLADEMKRVEELSQELHRINDDRDRNVEVLSAEASSLALKVEELTMTTQDMREREVQFLAQIQAAQDLETEYLSLKTREEDVLSKLKVLESEFKVNQEQLDFKSKLVEALEVENSRLKEAGKSLKDVFARAKEAEAKCEKIQEDGANVLARIQKAEESERRISVLEKELLTLKEEKSQLLAELETVREKITVKDIESIGESTNLPRSAVDGFSLYSKEPVIEELCTVKKYADLTNVSVNDDNESTITDNEKMWENRYNRLMEEHQAASRENAEVIKILKEENLSMTTKEVDYLQKQRLWDRQGDDVVLDDVRNSSLSMVTIERLQQQLAATTTQLKESKKQHRQEVGDLRRILLNHGSGNSHSVSRSDNLEDATELEYLRNILFEYMMGKEPMVLARVIAAVVKFDSEQTNKILQKEQQRLTLLGQLGIS